MGARPPVIQPPATEGDKEQALHRFWSGFGWTARDENTVPDDAMTRYGGRYITYSVSTASLGEPVPIRLTAIGKEPTKLCDGTWATTDTQYTVSNGSVTITKFGTQQANEITLYMNRYPKIIASDSVRVLIKKTAGSLSGAVYTDGWVGNAKIVDNKLWNTGATAMDQTGTASAASTTATIRFRNRTGVKTWANYKCTVSIYINGTKFV